MSFRKLARQAPFNVLTAALILAGCSGGATPAPTIDINAINTAAVGTAMGQLSAQFTQTALAAPSPTPFPTNTPAASLTSAIVTAAGDTPSGSTGAPTVISLDPNASVTPLPGFTPLASPAAPVATTSLGDACDNNVFVGDLTIPDGTVLKPGEDFTKVWAVQNTGNCTWDDGYALIYVGGSKPDLDPVNLLFTASNTPGNKTDFILPGETADFDIKLTTPCTPGKYEGHWRMRNDRGQYFGTILSVYVEVQTKC